MGPPRRGGGVGLGDGLAAKRTFVGRSPRPCERAELAESRPKTGGGFPLLCNGRSPPSRRRQSGLDCRATLRSARNDAGWILSPLTGLQNDILSVHNKFLRFSCAIPNH